MHQKTLCYILLALLFAGCSVVGTNSDRSKLIGRWEWVRATGGISGGTITPDSAGVSEQQLNYTTARTFTFSRADTTVSSGIYSFTTHDGNTFIRYVSQKDSFFPKQQFKFKTNDTLILLDRCSDCYRSIYKRLK